MLNLEYDFQEFLFFSFCIFSFSWHARSCFMEKTFQIRKIKIKMKNKNGKKIPNIDKHHKTSLISTCCSPQSFFHQQLPQNYHSKFQINIDKHVAKEFDCCSIFTNTRLSNFLHVLHFQSV